MDKGRGGEGKSPSWNTRRLCRERLRIHLETTRLIDELGWVEPAGSLEDTVRSARQKVVTPCDYSMPRHKRRKAKGSMYWWNDQLVALRRECLEARRKFTRSKGDAMLRKTEALLVTDRRSYQYPRIVLGEHEVEWKTSIKYLGVQLDRRLSFGEHLKIAADKAIQCGANLARLMPNIEGHRDAKRRLVASVVHSKLL